MKKARVSFVSSAALVVAVGIFVRLLGWHNWSFWLDEAIQIDLVRRSIGEMWRSVVLDGVHPPFDYVVTWCWYRVSPAESWLRVLPVLWSVGAVVSVLVRAGGRSSPCRALAAASAFGTFPLAVYLGQELRPYAAGLCLAAAFDAARSRHESSGRRGPLVAAILLGSVACWTLYWAGLFVAFSWALDIAQSFSRRDRQRLKRVTVAGSLTLLLFVPWLIILTQAKLPERAPSSPRPTVELVLRVAGGLVGDRQEDVKQPVAAAVLWTLVLAGIVVGPREERLRTALELALLSAGVIIVLSLTGHWWALRYLAIALLPASRSIGFVAEAVASSWKARPAAGLAATAILLLLQRGAIEDSARWARPDWRRPANYLGFMAASAEGGPIVAADPWAYFSLKAQMRRLEPPVDVGLKPTATDLSAWIRGTAQGWVVRAPGFRVPDDLGQLLQPGQSWARFPEADECRLYRVESGRLVSP